MSEGNPGLSHLDQAGRAIMVDVGDKAATKRSAVARAVLQMQATTLQRVRDGAIAKGDVLAVAQVAAVMAAKKTSELIPLCHPLPLTAVNVAFTFVEDDLLHIDVAVQTTAQTGVEMEALTGATVGALTVYDMCKAIDRGMSVTFVGLLEKHGGLRGDYVR